MRPRPPSSTVAHPGRTDAPPRTQAAVAELAEALRDLQLDPRLPRSGAAGGVFYRAAGGRLAELEAGAAGEVLTMTAGLPVWRAVGAADVQALLDGLGTTHGAILFRGASGWMVLAPGTAGQVLETGGAGADPAWANAGGVSDGDKGDVIVSGGGTVWSVDVFTAAVRGLAPASGGGTANFLRADATWAAPTAAVAAYEVEIDLGAVPVTQGRFTIVDGLIGATNKVLVWQAPGPYTDKGTMADEAELQPVSVLSVVPAAGSCSVAWQTPPITVYTRTGRDIGRASRIGRIRGYVKFLYQIAS